jgi:hypothetical protein
VARRSARDRSVTDDTDGSLVVDRAVLDALRAELPVVAPRTVAAVVAEVEEYADPLRGQLGENITSAVELALGTFLRLVDRPAGDDSQVPVQPALDGAYALGRGEARAGRTIDALLSAYRVGARVAWAEWGTLAVAAGLSPLQLVRFAERVFAYIDQLSAASVAGHGDELAVSGRVREQYRERLGRALLRTAPDDELTDRAARADWEPPAELTAVLVAPSAVRMLAARLDRRTIVLSADLLDDGRTDGLTVLLVPVSRRGRQQLRQQLADIAAVMGPVVGWQSVATSYRRAVRAYELHGVPRTGLDTEAVLTDLVLNADPAARADLRVRALAPLAGLAPATADRLAETLLSWLLHQGRREDVARALSVHPQTVRYRMTQVRDRYGDALLDPVTVRDLVVALAGVEPGASGGA